LIFTDRFCVYPEVLARTANQLTGLGGAEGSAARKNDYGFKDAGFSGPIAAKQDVKPVVGQDVYLLKVP
jgi:hypothetical protein